MSSHVSRFALFTEWTIRDVKTCVERPACKNLLAASSTFEVGKHLWQLELVATESASGPTTYGIYLSLLRYGAHVHYQDQKAIECSEKNREQCRDLIDFRLSHWDAAGGTFRQWDRFARPMTLFKVRVVLRGFAT